MKKYSIIILASLFVVLTVGCGENNKEEKSKDLSQKFAESLIEGIVEHAASEDGKNVDIDIDLNKDGTGGIIIKGENGEEVVFSGNKNEIPETFPKDVYLVKGEIESVGSMKSNEGEIITVVIKAKDNFKDAVEKIKSEMKDNGWASTMNMNMDGDSMQIYTKEDKSVTITANNKKEVVEVVYIVTVKIN